jgi:hypothetical protein
MDTPGFRKTTLDEIYLNSTQGRHLNIENHRF